MIAGESDDIKYSRRRGKNMRMSKKLRANAARVLAVTMMMSMSGITAFAEETTHTEITYVTVTKSVVTDGRTYAPDTSFEFTLSPSTVTTTENTDGAYVFPGVDGGLLLQADTSGVGTGEKSTTITLTYAPDPKSVPLASYDKTVGIAIDIEKFTKPGIYHYTLQETQGSYEGIAYDTAVRDLYVYIFRNDKDDHLYCDSVITVKQGETGKTELTFTNNYGKEGDKPDPNPGTDPTPDPTPDPEPDPNDTTHDIIVSKEVTGSQGDRTMDFNFEVKIQSGDENAHEYYYIEYGTVTEGVFTPDEKKATSNTVIAIPSSNTATTIKLKHGQAFRISGLSESDTYDIKEVSADAGDGSAYLNGYKTTVNGVEAQDRAITGTLTSDATLKAYVNNKDAASPTGIILTIAPYALLVALAGVFAVLFLRRRKEEDF
jgi:pilin isopeptide linkage protein